MVFLLVFHNDPERPPHAFLLQRVSDRVLVTNLQLFHRSPPPSYSAGRERRLLSRRLTCSCPASACTPACGPPDQSFYGLRLPHRTGVQVLEESSSPGHAYDQNRRQHALLSLWPDAPHPAHLRTLFSAASQAVGAAPPGTQPPQTHPSFAGRGRVLAPRAL